MEEGDWLPWANWLRNHPVIKACVIALGNAAVLVAVDYYWMGRREKPADYVVIAAASVLLGLVSYVYGRRDRRVGR
jgi:hypothetical protein